MMYELNDFFFIMFDSFFLLCIFGVVILAIAGFFYLQKKIRRKRH